MHDRDKIINQQEIKKIPWLLFEISQNLFKYSMNKTCFYKRNRNVPLAD